MRLRLQPGLVALAVVGLCLAVLSAFYFTHAHRLVTPEAMIACLPPREAAVVYVDVGALRRSGILYLLAGSKATEELEYKNFVEATEFDYRRDLDSVAAAFAPDGTFLVVKGRFNWKRLSNYTIAGGGRCMNGLCQATGSGPDKRISFYLLKPDTLALAVSPDSFAAGDISVRRKQPVDPLPREPIWISVPAAVLKAARDLPAGTHSYATALSSAEKIVFAAGPENGRLEVQMKVTCASPETASAMALQLENVTDLLRKMIEREHQVPNPKDLAGVLTAGTFQPEGRMVLGHWFVERAFIDTLAGGSLN